MDAEKLTEALRTALDDTISGIQSLGYAQAAAELTAIRDSLAAPPEACEALGELDRAILSALNLLPEYFSLAPQEEIARTIKLLRRMLLSDRRRIDPDPRRQMLNLTLCARQAQLLERQASFHHAQTSLHQTRSTLARITNAGEYKLMLNHLQLLEEYCGTHKEYIQHLQEEIRLLRAELSS